MPRKKSDPFTGLGLKIVRPNGTTHNGYVWPPNVGDIATAPDWRDDTECGGGLHFWKDGEGNVTTCGYHAEKDAIGFVVAFVPGEERDCGGKHKAPRLRNEFRGTVREAAAWLCARRLAAKVIYGQATAGDYGQATAGGYGQATAGYSGQATAGYSGQATAGDYGTISIRYYDRKLSVYRRKVAECDPAGPVKPWHTYKVSAEGEWVDLGELPADKRPAAVMAAALAKVTAWKAKP